jgi:hypothetical protein
MLFRHIFPAMTHRMPRILASARISEADIGGSGLTTRQREHRLDHSGRQLSRAVHDFKTKAAIAAPR